MALRIETFDNRTGGNCFFKAIGHPAALPKVRALLSDLARSGPVAIYDPQNYATPFAEIHSLSALKICGVFVQDVTRVGDPVLGLFAQPVTELAHSGANTVLVLAFDAERVMAHIRHLLPSGSRAVSLDAIKIPAERLTNTKRYLDPLNFATNFAFFRDEDGQHTRLATANYWSGYGASKVALWLTLFDITGEVLADWCEEQIPGVSTIKIDSAEVRRHFGLPAFTGQLFVHATGAAGHDVVKYALDTYGDDGLSLSCTHDANAWPADLFAGLPAPRADERVILWVQNSHPREIPEKAVGLNEMGSPEIAWLDRTIPAFASYPLDVSTLLPELRWPSQIEIQAGRHFVRPRYEVIRQSGRRRIAHPNVQRTDLKPDPKIPELANLLGRGFILPAPVLPTDRFSTAALPTPMSTAQRELPIAITAYDSTGRELGRRSLGRLPRRHATAIELDEMLGPRAKMANGYGHLELSYDFSAGGEADGWLHGLFRYELRSSGHAAETSFGAHIFNTALTYKNEPQSYSGPAPGLSTRLFLRLGPDETLCHLIYPASTPWHGTSDTRLSLHGRGGEEVAHRDIQIPCGGSRLFFHTEMFTAEERRSAGSAPYVIIRDVTCRLFGYHGLMGPGDQFSLDHMFGF